MPNCSECNRFKEGICSSRPWGDSLVNQLRGCSVAGYQDFLDTVKPGMNVLEIGVGSWPYCNDHCYKAGISWIGIDILSDSIANIIASVSDLPFKDNSIDVVLGSNSIEHWKENGCRLTLGIYECFRVCKIGGKLFFNAPIYFHGSSEFVRGRLSKIKGFFELFTNEIELEIWGDGVRLNDYPMLRKTPAKVLSILAVKTREVYEKPKNYLFKQRLVRELLDHSPFYIAWKLKNKIQKLRK